MFFSEFCKIFKNTFFVEHLRTTAPSYQQNFITANYCNYDLINSFNIFKKTDFLTRHTDLPLRISFYIFYHIQLAVCIYWHLLIYIFYLAYTYFELLKRIISNISLKSFIECLCMSFYFLIILFSLKNKKPSLKTKKRKLLAKKHT